METTTHICNDGYSAMQHDMHVLTVALNSVLTCMALSHIPRYYEYNYKIQVWHDSL